MEFHSSTGTRICKAQDRIRQLREDELGTDRRCEQTTESIPPRLAWGCQVSAPVAGFDTNPRANATAEGYHKHLPADA